MFLLRPFLAFLGLSLGGGAKPDPAAIQIDVGHELFASHTFPKGNPPPHRMIAAPAQEAGWCATEILPQAAVNIEWHRLGFKTVTATVTKVQFSTAMHIDIWVEEGSSAQVAAHEATHRAISEYYYAQAENVARDIASQVMARQIKLPVRHQNENAKDTVEALDEEILATFNWRIWQRCEYAQERFDDITAHGCDPIKNDAAMKQALADEAAHWEQVKNSPVPVPDNETVKLGP